MITREEKSRQIENINSESISLYDLSKAKNGIRKGNENIKVLYILLLKEINFHNEKILKKIRKLRNLPTSN